MSAENPEPSEEFDDLFARARRGDPDAVDEVFERALDGDPVALCVLVELACEGSSRAREQLSIFIRPLLKEFLQRHCRGQDRAAFSYSDAVQSALGRAFAKLPTLEIRTGSGFVAWMKEILRNRLRDEERRRNRRIADAPGGNEGETAVDVEIPPSPVDAPYSAMQQSEGIDEILQQLSRIDGVIFYLRVCVELEFDEISDRLNARGFTAEGGMPFSGTIVAVRFRRARSKLRADLQESEPEEER